MLARFFSFQKKIAEKFQKKKLKKNSTKNCDFFFESENYPRLNSKSLSLRFRSLGFDLVRSREYPLIVFNLELVFPRFFLCMIMFKLLFSAKCVLKILFKIIFPSKKTVLP